MRRWVGEVALMRRVRVPVATAVALALAVWAQCCANIIVGSHARAAGFGLALRDLRGLRDGELPVVEASYSVDTGVRGPASL